METGKKHHEYAATIGLHTNKYVSAALITMYSKCGSMSSAQDVFDRMTQRDAVAWNSLILGYVDNGESTLAVELYTRMDCQATSFTLVAVLKACASLAGTNQSENQILLEKGMSIHESIKTRGFISLLIVANTLIHMYVKCGSLQRARQVFDEMNHRDVVTWTNVILGYSAGGEWREALWLFDHMDCQPDSFSYVAALKTCAGYASQEPSAKMWCLDKGIELHQELRGRGLDSDILIATTLVDMYCKCGSLQRARESFQRISVKDVASWNSLILGHVENGEHVAAMDLFTCIGCEPSSLTYIAALKACGALASQCSSERNLFLEKGIVLHKQVEAHGFQMDAAVGNTLVDMYCKCGDVRLAKDIFDRMENRNAIAWTTLMLGYVANGESRSAIDLFRRMDCEPSSLSCVAACKACATLASEKVCDKQFCLESGGFIHGRVRELGFEEDMLVANTLLDLYTKCGSMSFARETFNRMIQKNIVSWTTLMLGYVESGRNSKAIELFMSMDCEPDSVTYMAGLKASGNLASLVVGRDIQARVCKTGLEQEPSVANTLIDCYFNCGSTSRGEEVFCSVHSLDIVFWNTLIAGYSSVGDSSRVISLVTEMKESGVEMDSITSTCVLAACSHGGLVEESRACFESILNRKVEHFNCMVDVLGRANRLQEALDLIKAMPCGADSITWMTLLGACRKWKNVQVGRAAFDALVSAGTAKPAAYTLMRDIYASLSMWNNMEGMAGEDKSVRPGQAWWCDSSGRTFEFVMENERR